MCPLFFSLLRVTVNTDAEQCVTHYKGQEHISKTHLIYTLLYRVCSGNDPLFMFGDLNFRLDLTAVVKVSFFLFLSNVLFLF